ncbi:MAG: phosphoribosyltransferase family protein [bacterium]|nr:phosphoribosyltransferase family protein [bacterium]
MQQVLKNIYQGLLNIIFPPLCYACHSYLAKNEKELNVCAKCISSIKIWNGLFCPVCKSRQAIYPEPVEGLPLRRPPCHPRAPFTLAACSDYGNPAVKGLLHTFKYKKIENAIRPITELLIRPYIKTIFPELIPTPLFPERSRRDAILIPIPLHPSKKRSRGFNQSELIAYALLQCLNYEIDYFVIPAEAGIQTPFSGFRIKSGMTQKIYSREAREDIGLPRIETDILKRTKQTDPQAETKSAKERRENVRGCFSLNPKFYPPAGGLNPTSSVILVDDVYTSGATMAEAVRVLKDAGAKHVLAFVIAKT